MKQNKRARMVYSASTLAASPSWLYLEMRAEQSSLAREVWVSKRGKYDNVCKRYAKGTANVSLWRIQDLAAPGPQGEWFIGGIGAYFNATMKRFASNKERCDVALPYLINDVHAHLTTYTSRLSKIISPFDDMWNLIYQLTHRTLGCHDIADDPKLLAKTLPFAQALSKSTTMEVLFPWLPVPNRLRKLWASGRLAWILVGLAKKRRRSGKQGDDIMQTLINHDHENIRIAAASNSPTLKCNMLTIL